MKFYDIVLLTALFGGIAEHQNGVSVMAHKTLDPNEEAQAEGAGSDQV